jgi:hypothetical protein
VLLADKMANAVTVHFRPMIKIIFPHYWSISVTMEQM